MNILITLSGKNYMAQAKAQIEKDGSFISEKFSSYGTALKAGTYKVEISSSIVSLQPVDVQKLLGSKGRNLVGMSVSDDLVNGKTLSYCKEITMT